MIVTVIDHVPFAFVTDDSSRSHTLGYWNVQLVALPIQQLDCQSLHLVTTTVSIALGLPDVVELFLSPY